MADFDIKSFMINEGLTRISKVRQKILKEESSTLSSENSLREEALYYLEDILLDRGFKRTQEKSGKYAIYSNPARDYDYLILFDDPYGEFWGTEEGEKIISKYDISDGDSSFVDRDEKHTLGDITGEFKPMVNMLKKAGWTLETITDVEIGSEFGFSFEKKGVEVSVTPLKLKNEPKDSNYREFLKDKREREDRYWNKKFWQNF